MPYPRLDRNRIRVLPLARRKSKSSITDIAIDPESVPLTAPHIQETVMITAQKIIEAKHRHAAVIMAYGAHLVKNGAGPIAVKMMENGWLTHLATQGAGTIHDWEFAFHGRSEEDVRANVATGTFGTWEETGKFMNLAVLAGGAEGMGYGESIGAMIHNDGISLPDPESLRSRIVSGLSDRSAHLSASVDLLQAMERFGLTGGLLPVAHPYKKYAIAGNAYKKKIPLTVHPGIGYDIIYNNPYASGAALGRGAHIDFYTFARSVSNLTSGVFLSIGSAIMAPQVFEKALSLANNLSLQDGRAIRDHYILVNDLQELNWDWSQGEPPKSSPDYYLRFLKTFHRMGASVRYVSADNRVFLHHLYKTLKECDRD
jgi:hypothetical protein